MLSVWIYLFDNEFLQKLEGNILFMKFYKKPTSIQRQMNILVKMAMQITSTNL